MEQTPEAKDRNMVEEEVSKKLNAKCCKCRQPWTSYRGKHKCNQIACGVPVIVCDTCHSEITGQPHKNFDLKCELCREGYRAPQEIPDLVALRLKAENLVSKHNEDTQEEPDGGTNDNTTTRAPRKACPDRLFLSRLPLNVRRGQIEEWLQTPIKRIQWLTDKDTDAFYGSCIVEIDEKIVASLVDEIKSDQQDASKATVGRGQQVVSVLGYFPGTVNEKKRKRRQQQPKVAQAIGESDGQPSWPPEDYKETEFPPLGNLQ